MSSQSKKSKRKNGLEPITKISISGYKSIVQKQSVEVRPLTILAGANSSGKSSIVQPLLLLKQTLESSYDPGPLLLNGPNVKFTSVDQMFSKTGEKGSTNSFSVELHVNDGNLKLSFTKSKIERLELSEMSVNIGKSELILRPNMSQEEKKKYISLHPFTENFRELQSLNLLVRGSKEELEIKRNRCFLEARLDQLPLPLSSTLVMSHNLRGLIHLPGLRGNPERTYPVTAVGSNFPGTFEQYCASIISKWEKGEEGERLNKDLKKLGLTSRVVAKKINDAQVELQVGRLVNSRRFSKDLVSIADVGFGVSQTLPLLVALHVAKPGQMVYLEQPEIHLHPRAQIALAEVFVDAVERGVVTIIETHSSLLLLAIQAIVAEKKFSPQHVSLNWFTRGDDGTTKVASAELDENGAFGDWPVDFDEVSLEAQSRYLDAAEKHYGNK